MARFPGMIRWGIGSAVGAMLALAGASSVSAQDEATSKAVSYASSQGFAAVDLATHPLETRLRDALAKAGPGFGKGPLTALETALLLVDLEEKPLLRVRYVVRLGQQAAAGGPLTLLEVDRYNLGPASRAEAIDAYGEDNTAGPEEFGVGPHMGWRFVMQPTGGGDVALLAAGRREVPEEEAAAASCYGRTCLSLDLIDDLKAWKDARSADFPAPKRAYPSVHVTGEGDDRTEEEVPAHVALQLSLMLGAAKADKNGVQWVAALGGEPGSAHSLPALVIDRNAGQEIMTDSIMGIAGTGHEKGPRWVRRMGGASDGVVDARFQTAKGPISAK